MTTREQLLQIVAIVSKGEKQSTPVYSLQRLMKSRGEVGEALRAIIDSPKKYEGVSRLSRSRVLVALKNQLLHLDLRKLGLSVASREYYQNSRQLLLMRVLLMLGARRTGIHIATQGYVAAASSELTENAIAFAIELRRDAALLGNLRSHQKWQTELTTLVNRLAAEQLAHFYVERLNVKFAKSKSAKKHLAKIGLENAAEIEMMMQVSPSRDLRLSHYRLVALSYQIDHQYTAAIASCEEAVHFLTNSDPPVPPLRIGEFCLKRLNCLMLMGSSERALDAIEETAGYFENSSMNLLLLEEYRLLVYLQLERWQDAKEVYERVHDGIALRTSSEIIRERWNVYRLFVSYTANAEGQTLLHARAAADAVLSRIGGTIKRDKAGIFFSVHLLRILILLRAKEFSALIDAIESIQSYVYRHLGASTSHRERLLVKYLRKFARSDFFIEADDALMLEIEANLLERAGGVNVLSGFHILSDASIIKMIKQFAR